MSEGYEFETYTATVEGEESTVQAATVTEEQEGNTVNTRGGVRAVREGDVLVPVPDMPGAYDVLTADEWAETGYSVTDEPQNDDDTGKDFGLT